MKILIADDHKVVRLGLSLIVKEEYANAEILQAADGNEVLNIARHHKLDLVLMDLRMPDTDSISLIEQLLIEFPDLKILIISLNPEKVFALRYLQLGAFGYVQKSENDEIITKAIRRVMSGKKYMSDDVIDIMTEYLKNGNTHNPFDSLTKREFEVSMYLINGLSTSDICNLMCLQSSTVSTFKNRILEKLNVKNVFELTELAKQHNIA